MAIAIVDTAVNILQRVFSLSPLMASIRQTRTLSEPGHLAELSNSRAVCWLCLWPSCSPVDVTSTTQSCWNSELWPSSLKDHRLSWSRICMNCTSPTSHLSNTNRLLVWGNFHPAALLSWGKQTECTDSHLGVPTENWKACIRLLACSLLVRAKSLNLFECQLSHLSRWGWNPLPGVAVKTSKNLWWKCFVNCYQYKCKQLRKIQFYFNTLNAQIQKLLAAYSQGFFVSGPPDLLEIEFHRH